MKKKVLIGIAVALALVGIGIAVTPAANATEPQPVSEIANAALPSDASGYKFWSPSVCVQAGTNTSGYPIAYAAQQWNVQASPVLKLDFSYNCVADGYPPSRRMTVGVYSAPNDPYCLAYLNTEATPSNGLYLWTNEPVVLVNYAHAGCVGSTARKNHFTSMAIGAIIGMKSVNWPNSLNRVMNSQSWSVLNVPWATPGEGQRIWELYTGAYGG